MNWENLKSKIVKKKISSRYQKNPKATPDAPKNPTNLKKEPNLNKLGKYIALDCEMVGVGDGSESILARVSIVNFNGEVVLDAYVKPREKVVDYRTKFSGISPSHIIHNENAIDFKTAQDRVSKILENRILIGHALKNDLNVLLLSHPKKSIRDTSKYSEFRKISHGRTPSLKILAKEILGTDIHAASHCSIEDARIAMLLYRKHRIKWEAECIKCSEKPN